MICALIAREMFQLELELQAGFSSYHALYMYEYIWYVEVPGSPVPYVRIYECVRTRYDVRTAYLGFVVVIVDVVVCIYLDDGDDFMHLLFTLYTQIDILVFIV